MKVSIFLITLFVLLYPSVVFSQEPASVHKQLQAAKSQLEIQRIQLGLEQSKAESDFRRQMQELELEERRIEVERQRKKLGHRGRWKSGHKKCAVPFVLLCFVVNILVTVWVYQDIRKRNVGSGIWIVVALLTGLLGVLVYAIVRLGDSRQT